MLGLHSNIKVLTLREQSLVGRQGLYVYKRGERDRQEWARERQMPVAERKKILLDGDMTSLGFLIPVFFFFVPYLQEVA